MAGTDSDKALACKAEGNKYFQCGDYTRAESFYQKAISHDPTTPVYHTNHAMALLKLQKYPEALSASRAAIALSPSMKGYFSLAQAQIALKNPKDAVVSAKTAHKYCVQEFEDGGKGANSLGAITELVLRCLREDWERRESERLEGREGVLREVVGALEREREGRLGAVEDADVERRVREEYEGRIEGVREAFEIAGKANAEDRRRKVPDWAVDGITFSVMVDPVSTKTGQSYDRSSIMEHLKRSPTDPLTREPLTAAELRPNLGLRTACEEFLFENGWAVDW